jgi:hypothetical protein
MFWSFAVSSNSRALSTSDAAGFTRPMLDRVEAARLRRSFRGGWPPSATLALDRHPPLADVEAGGECPLIGNMRAVVVAGWTVGRRRPTRWGELLRQP